MAKLIVKIFMLLKPSPPSILYRIGKANIEWIVATTSGRKKIHSICTLRLFLIIESGRPTFFIMW